MIDLNGELPVEHDHYPNRNFDFNYNDELMESKIRSNMAVFVDWTKNSILNYWNNGGEKIEA